MEEVKKEEVVEPKKDTLKSKLYSFYHINQKVIDYGLIGGLILGVSGVIYYKFKKK